MLRAASLLFLAAGLLLPGLNREASAQEEKGPLRLSVGDDGTVSWQDEQGATNYHVSGKILYLPAPSCGSEQLEIDGEQEAFDQLLPAGTTSFALPLSNDERLTFKKESVFNIEALDADSNVIVRDGFALTADGVCPEEQLAAAGSGPATSGGSNIAIIATLLAVGVGVLGAGAITRRMRSV